MHGTAELAFTGAAAGLVAANNPVLGALLGSIVVATAIGLLGNRERERNSAIGVILAFGMAVGVYLLSLYRGFATAATNILFGQIFGVSPGQITLLTVIAIMVLIAMVVLYRPLLFASVDPELAQARGVPTRLVGLLFVYLLALTVTEAAQIVGTLLVLSLAITPAAAASRLSARTPVVIAISIAFALIAADGGLLLSPCCAPTSKPACSSRPSASRSTCWPGSSRLLYPGTAIGRDLGGPVEAGRGSNVLRLTGFGSGVRGIAAAQWGTAYRGFHLRAANR